MNAHSLVSRSCLVLVFLLSIGCNSVYRESLKGAQQAADRGDFLTAADFYQKACHASPNDKLACGQAPIFAQKAADRAVEHARPACEAGELDRCLHPLLEAQRLAPGHRGLTTLIEQASHLHAKRCAEWNQEGPLSTALAGLACLQDRSHQFRIPHYQSLITDSAKRLALRFMELAGAADAEASSGASAVLWSAAQCLSPGTDHSWRAQQALKDFLDSRSIPVITYLGGTLPPAIAAQLSNLCPHISPELPVWAVCTTVGEESGQRETLHLQIDAVVQNLQQTVQKREEYRQTLISTRPVKNPDYERAEKQLQSAAAALQQAEQQRLKAEQNPTSKCSISKTAALVPCKGCPVPPEKKIPCVQLAATNYRLKDEEFRKAKDQLSVVPKTVEQLITEPFKYTESTYTWTSNFRFTIKTNTPSTPIPLRQNGELRFTDTQRTGMSGLKAEIIEDPLEPPTDEAFAQAFLEKLKPHVAAAVRRDGEQRGLTRRAQCKELPADWSSSWVQCWAEASLWESGEQPRADKLLQLLVSSAGSAQQVKCR